VAPTGARDVQLRADQWTAIDALVTGADGARALRLANGIKRLAICSVASAGVVAPARRADAHRLTTARAFMRNQIEAAGRADRRPNHPSIPQIC
jgi:hypothetical protein